MRAISFRKQAKKFFTKQETYDKICAVRGISAVGSAQHWQCWGQEFESPMLHGYRKP